MTTIPVPTSQQDNITLTTSSIRQWKYFPSIIEIIIITVIMTIISFGIVIGNVVVIITLSIVEKLKQAAPNLLLLNLAISDLLEGLVFVPILIYQEVSVILAYNMLVQCIQIT